MAVLRDVISNYCTQTDYDDELLLENYCSENPPRTHFEARVRGYVFCGDLLVFKSAPFPYEYHFKNFPEKPTILDIQDKNIIGDLSKYKITKMREGTLIRLFYIDGHWKTTTNRKLDVYKSKWGNKSFGDIFKKTVEDETKEPIEDFYNILNIEYSYTFIIGTIESTRIVSPVKQYITLVSVKNSEHKEVEDPNLKSLKQNTLNFNTIENVVKYVESLKFPFDDCFGVFLSSPDKNIKIVNTEYKQYENLRHNLPSIPFAYLHNCFDEKNNKTFRFLYPEFTETFDKYDKKILEIVENLKDLYIKKHVKKEEYYYPTTEYCILYKIHNLYLKTFKPITSKDIYEVLKTVSPVRINQMISGRRRNYESRLDFFL